MTDGDRSQPQRLAKGSLVGHVVAHSHCDPGYKKTVDEYYETEVRAIFESVLTALENDERTKFIWAETIFLDQWLSHDIRTSERKRSQWKKLVAEGRIEIVNGGFVMHDEAISRYDSQILQMTYGHIILKETLFDGVPDILTGYQIDPFGPTLFNVKQYVRAGMQYMIHNRIPQHIKDELKRNQSLEFYWRADDGGDQIFVHVLDSHYASPAGFDWEDVLVPAPPVTPENVEERSDAYMSILQNRSSYYRTNHVYLPFGTDFRFQNASHEFGNMTLIMDYVNGHPERYEGNTLRYSTVRDYMSEMLQSANELASKQGSSIFPKFTGSPFLPYWSGYFTQLPALKQMIRVCEMTLRMVKVHLFQCLRNELGTNGMKASKCDKIWDRLKPVQETVFLMQHHDALPATGYRFFLSDCMRRLRNSFLSMQDLLSELLTLGDHTSTAQKCVSSPFSFCEEKRIIGGGPYYHETVMLREPQNARGIQLDQVLDPRMGGRGIDLAVLNSLSWTEETVIHFVCTRADVAIVQKDGESVISQATPLEHDLDSANNGLFLISFRASVPPLGMSAYSVHVCDLTWLTDQSPPAFLPQYQCAERAKEIAVDDIVNGGLSSSLLRIEFSPETNDIESMERTTEAGKRLRVSLTHDIVIYDGKKDTIYDMETSLEESDPSTLLGSAKRELQSAYVGRVFSQVSLRYSDFLSVRYRLMQQTDRSDLASLLEVSMRSGPLPPSVNVASRFTTDLKDSSWYYDENGFYPVHCSYNESQGVGYNLRPLVSRSWLKEQSTNGDLDCPLEFSVHTVDPRGTVSRAQNSIDIFWQRRNNGTDDWLKQGQDMSTVRSSVWLDLSCDDSPATTLGASNLRHRRIATTLANDLILMSLGQNGPTSTRKDYSPRKPFGDELHLVSVSPWQASTSTNKKTFIVHIENLSESSSRTVSLSELLSPRLSEKAQLFSLTFLYHETASENCKIHFDAEERTSVTIRQRELCALRIPVPDTTSSRNIWRHMALGSVIMVIGGCYLYRRRRRRRDSTKRRPSQSNAYEYSDNVEDDNDERESEGLPLQFT